MLLVQIRCQHQTTSMLPPPSLDSCASKNATGLQGRPRLRALLKSSSKNQRRVVVASRSGKRVSGAPGLPLCLVKSQVEARRAFLDSLALLRAEEGGDREEVGEEPGTCH